MHSVFPWDHGKLTVSENKRFLCHEDGTPFFWLGDTGWMIFNKLTREEIDHYLEERRVMGFNVIQVMVLHHLPAISVYGASALEAFDCEIWSTEQKSGYDPDDYSYWDHADYTIEKAAEKGIYIALVPIWGTLVDEGHLSLEAARSYGKWLAQRYRDKPNIIWLNGGDTKGSENTEIWKALGTAIKEYDSNHLMTFHPFGRMQSSMWFQNEEWLDFNMFQSGHRRYDQKELNKKLSANDDWKGDHEWKGEDNWRYVEEDLSKTPLKPTIDGEPSYEGIPQGLHDPSEPYWTEDDCRRYAYWSVFAGAFGHTYGHSAIMQMHKPENGKGAYGVKKYWYDAIHDPGACQMAHLKNLILAVPFFERIPDQSVIAGGQGEMYERLIATRGADYAFVYTYTGRSMGIHMGKISGKEVNAWWFDPRDGSMKHIGKFENAGTAEFNPPGEHKAGNDWVLVLADAETKYFHK